MELVSAWAYNKRGQALYGRYQPHVEEYAGYEVISDQISMSQQK